MCSAFIYISFVGVDFMFGLAVILVDDKDFADINQVLFDASYLKL